MIADDMTKLLSSQKQKEFIKQLKLVDTKHLIDDSNRVSKLCEHRVSSYFKTSINIRKIGFRASMLISTAKHFTHKSDHFGIISTPFSELISVGFQLIQPPLRP
jgi:hypothetical protein